MPTMAGGMPGSKSACKKEGLLPPVEADARAPPAEVQLVCAMKRQGFSPQLGFLWNPGRCAVSTEEGMLGDEQKDTWILGRLNRC